MCLYSVYAIQECVHAYGGLRLSLVSSQVALLYVQRHGHLNPKLTDLASLTSQPASLIYIRVYGTAGGRHAYLAFMGC